MDKNDAAVLVRIHRRSPGPLAVAAADPSTVASTLLPVARNLHEDLIAAAPAEDRGLGANAEPLPRA